MQYRLFFADAAGHPLTLTGRKEVRDDSVLDIWSDTSTLYFLLLPAMSRRRRANREGVGAGVAHIHPADFAHQLTTVRTTGPGKAEALLDFGHFFLGQLWDVYGRHLSKVPAGVS